MVSYRLRSPEAYLSVCLRKAPLLMRFACSTASFPEDRLQIAIVKAGWAGFEALELSLTGDDLPTAADLQSHLRANDLELAAVRAGALPPEGGEAGLAALGRIGRAASLARSLDGSLLVVEAPAEGTRDGLARALRMLDQALGEVTMDVCLVNRTGTLLARVEDLNELWNAGLPERAGLALDPGQAGLAGWDPADLDSLPELPGHVYLNDTRAGRIVPPGEGAVDLGALGEALRLRGYGGAVCLSLENADPWAVEPVAREARAAAEAWFG